MHRLRRMRTGMSGGRDQGRHRAGPGKMAGIERPICRGLAQYRRKERSALRRRGFRRRGRKIRKVLQRGRRRITVGRVTLVAPRCRICTLSERLPANSISHAKICAVNFRIKTLKYILESEAKGSFRDLA